MGRKTRALKVAAKTLLLIAGSWFAQPIAFAASANTSLLKAKQEAEAKGQIFFGSRDEIVNKAKKEGKLRVVSGLVDSLPTTTAAFRKRYPFIDLQVESLKGVDLGPRALLQVEGGAAKDLDIMRTHTDFYSDWLPHLWKVDLLGMAEHGVLAIPPKMIDPMNRNVIALVSRFAAVPYNKNLVSPDQVPKTWEDMLKPDWKGRKFGVDIRPQELAALVPAWGLEKTLDYARKVTAQQPIWSRGGTRALVALAAGEIPLYLFGANYASVIRAQRKDTLGVIQYTVLEPVPLRISVEQAILATSRNPHAALLWMEFMAGPDAQKLIDEHEPLTASVYSKGSATEQAVRGKKLSVVSWEDNARMEQWIGKLVEAYGFPKADLK